MGEDQSLSVTELMAAELAAERVQIQARIEEELRRGKKTTLPDEVPPLKGVAGKGRACAYVRADGWRPMIHILYHMAKTGRSLEIELLRCHLPDFYADRLRPTETELSRMRRGFDALVSIGFVVKKPVSIFRSRIDFNIVELTEEGKKYCQSLGWEPVQSDFELLKEKHRGEEQLRHSGCVLLFAMHARLRGWAVQLVPEVKEPVSMYGRDYDPDLLIMLGETRSYVEVESHRKASKITKWKNAYLAQTFVALCTITRQRRITLEKEVTEEGYVRCVSTDLETLNKRLRDTPGQLGDLFINRVYPTAKQS